jgi:hypothetical protein
MLSMAIFEIEKNAAVDAIVAAFASTMSLSVLRWF